MTFRLSKLAPFALGLALAALVPTLANAATGSATTGAIISRPIVIENVSDIDFGSVIAGSGSGQVELNIVDGNRYCYTTAICGPGAHSFTEFNVKGTGMVRISYPLSIPFTGPSGPDMYIDLQARHIGGSVFAPGTLVPVDADGEVMRFGGWLHMNPDQPNGDYSGSFDMTVEYP
jgi:Mat/Ecp fimbriae major subunit